MIGFSWHFITNTYPDLYEVIDLENNPPRRRSLQGGLCKNLLKDEAGQIITNPNPSRGCAAAEAWIRISDYLTCRVLKQIFFQIYD